MWSLIPTPWKIGSAVALFSVLSMSIVWYRHTLIEEGVSTCEAAHVLADAKAKDVAQINIKKVEKSYEKTTQKVLLNKSDNSPAGPRVHSAIDSLPSPYASHAK